MIKSSDGTLRVVLIGGGKMAQQHAIAISLCRNARLVAVADPVVPVSELAEKFGQDLEFFSDPVVMLERIQPDVAHIVTPPRTHVELALHAIRLGANVYVEKPFALTAADAQLVIRAAEERGLKVCAAHQLLFQDVGYRVRESLRLIGDVVHVESYFSFRQVRTAGKARISTVDQLIDILPHPVYLLLSVMNPDGDTTNSFRLESAHVSVMGDIRAVISFGERIGVLVVSLRGRPIESYLRIVGTNGSLLADFVISGLTSHLGPGHSAISVVLQPFSHAIQKTVHTIANVFRTLFKKHKSYPGLVELLEEFYSGVSGDRGIPVTSSDILQTVSLCESITEALREQEAQVELSARQSLERTERELKKLAKDSKSVLVTGGTGFLGRVISQRLRVAGFRVVVPARRLPSYSERVAGVEYLHCDLSGEFSPAIFGGIDLVVHCAAETSGGTKEHELNTIQVTRNLLDAMSLAGVSRLIEIGSLAVLKPPRSPRENLSETSPVDLNNASRGPYVFAKALQEDLVNEHMAIQKMQVCTLRVGPLVDYKNFVPPGRLGRELGPIYLAVGRKSSELNVCDVHTAADVVVHLVSCPNEFPRVIHVIESPAPTRVDLIQRSRATRPDLKVVWVPGFLFQALDLVLLFASKISFGRVPSFQFYPAFASLKYDRRAFDKMRSEMSLPRAADGS